MACEGRESEGAREDLRPLSHSSPLYVESAAFVDSRLSSYFFFAAYAMWEGVGGARTEMRQESAKPALPGGQDGAIKIFLTGILLRVQWKAAQCATPLVGKLRGVSSSHTLLLLRSLFPRLFCCVLTGEEEPRKRSLACYAISGTCPREPRVGTEYSGKPNVVLP